MPVTKKVDTDTLVAKYRAYPNKKNTKVLKKFMAARRSVWNHFLGIQNQYYDKINEYILNQIDQSQLDEIKNTLKECEDKTDKESKKKFQESFKLLKKLKKEVSVPSSVAKDILKEIDPTITDKEIIKELTEDNRDSSQARRLLDSIVLRKQLKHMKKAEDTKWLGKIHSNILSNACIDLDTAWKTFLKDESNRSGKPRFKSWRDEGGFRIDSYKLDYKDGFIISDKFKLKLKFKKHREIIGTPKAVTVRQDKVGDFWASINFRQQTNAELLDIDSIDESNTIGVDLGIKDDLLILSNGTSVKNPKFFKTLERKHLIHSKRFSRKQKGSKSFEKQRKLNSKIDRKIVRMRKDHYHKVSDALTKDSKIKAIVFEDLNVAGMITKNKPKQDDNGNYIPNNQSMKRGFNKATSKAAMSELMQMIEYKAKRNGVVFARVDRFYPSSKTCSCCGYIKKDLKVEEQYWVCPECNVKHERNYNAAENIKKEGLRIIKEAKQAYDSDDKKYNKLSKNVKLFGNA